MADVARALWYTAPQTVEIRAENLVKPSDNHVYLHTLASSISRGTEAIVFNGDVPPDERERMQAPFQQGEFPFPVKYGYANVAEVKKSYGSLQVGQHVFSLYPHQDKFWLREDALYVVPEEIPYLRATLTANMETALNILWDAAVLPCSRVMVVGIGTVGALVGYLAARIAGVKVCLVDVIDSRREVADAFGCDFSTPEFSPGNQDVVIHCSATAEGLNTAIRAAGREARIVEASWYGSRPSGLALGGSFHSQRLQLVSSQVSTVSPIMRPRWTNRRRMEAAIDLLKDDVLDALIAPSIRLEECPLVLGSILIGSKRDALCHPVTY